jgi:hypothetical protein
MPWPQSGRMQYEENKKKQKPRDDKKGLLHSMG